MRKSAFHKYDNRTTHEKWCDTMVAKARGSRTSRPMVCVMKSRPQPKEPTYSNYELREMLKKTLTN